MDIKDRFEVIKKTIKSVYFRLDKFTGGMLEILRRTFRRFAEERGSEAAASLAYYAFFSIFPMLLVFIVVASFFVDRVFVETQLLALLSGVIPGAENVIIQNINQVLRLRGAVTFIAIIFLIWSATSVFSILVKNINRAFPKARIPDFFKGRFLGFLILLALGLLMMLSFGTSTLIGLFPRKVLPIYNYVVEKTMIWQVVSFLMPVVINWLMFWALFHWVPMVHVKPKASFWGGLIVGVMWVLLNNAFTWYLNSGLIQYRLVYGSVGTVVAFLFWIYLTATIILLGAHLTAAIQFTYEEESDESEA